MTSAYERLLAVLRDAGCTVDDRGDHGSASTPGHSSADRGTTFRRTETGVIVAVHNADKAAVLASLGLTLADLYDQGKTNYRYADGRIVTRSYRDGRKRFRQQHAEGTALYGSEVLPADTTGIVLVVEGEADVVAARSADVHAVSQAQGASTPPERADWTPLRGRPVWVVADRDKSGRARAAAVAAHLQGLAASVLIVEAAAGNDLADHIAAHRPIGDLVPVADDTPLTESDEWFWSARPELKHIREFARAYGSGPYAVLGVVLVRCVVATEPAVTLPALVGGPGSLNLFLALVGASGNGKDAATATGNKAVRLLSASTRVVTLVGRTPVGGSLDVPELPLGSGEGIRATYLVPGRPSKDEPRPEPVRIATRAMFSASEVDGAAALAARNGSTLMAELRKVWVGASIGAANAGTQFRVVVPAHTYRAGVIAGVQPARSGILLGDADGGTPQRWLWLPVTDPDAPPLAEDAGELPTVQPIDIVIASGTTETVMTLPSEVVREIRGQRHAVLTEKPGIDPLDGHRLFLREKIAAALAILGGRTKEITNDDWVLAGHLMNVSDNARNKCARVLHESQQQQNNMKAHAQADREGITEERREDRERARVRRKVLAALASGEWVTRGELNRGLKSDMRAHLDATLKDLITEGRVTSRPGTRTPEYRLCTE